MLAPESLAQRAATFADKQYLGRVNKFVLQDNLTGPTWQSPHA